VADLASPGAGRVHARRRAPRPDPGRL